MTNDRTRPDLDDATVEAVGLAGQLVEAVQQAARLLQDAVHMLRTAGHTALAGDLDRDLVGRNVVADRWTFQVVEDFDARAREELADGDRHVYEARMKQSERTRGHRRHEAGPALSD